MRKIIFLTLVMILGMSSVSFGKSYLCISHHGVVIHGDNKGVELNVIEDVSENKFIINTNGNNTKMLSVKSFGEDKYECKLGDVIRINTSIISGVGESMKGKHMFTCRHSHTSFLGSFTLYELNLDLSNMFFNSYENWNSSTTRLNMMLSGKCEEI